MNYKKMPICFYPTKVILIDDNEKFLESIRESLCRKRLTCMTYNNIEKALAFLENAPNKNKFTSKCHDNDEYEYLRSTSNIDLDFKNIYNEAFNPNRFSEISVIIVDYDMPRMKGDDFFNLLSNKYAKRIMLTGEADANIGINLLNQKIIDNFVSKISVLSIEMLHEKITTLQTNYFNDLCNPISDHLFPDTSYVNGTRYCEFVDNIINQLNISEHYTFTRYGSKLLLDSRSKASWLILSPEDEMQGFYETAYFADAPYQVTSKLKNRTHLPFLFSQSEREDSPKNWGKYMVLCNKVHFEGEPVYYSLLTNEDYNKINTSKILSHKDFLNSYHLKDEYE